METNNTRKNMKTSKLILLSVFFSIVVLVTPGCKKRPEVSWTDYNTVEDVYYHFTHNKEEAEAHLGDTLKVFGYIHICYENCYGMHEMTVSKELAHTYDGTLLYFNPFVILNSKTEKVIQNFSLKVSLKFCCQKTK